MGRAVQLVLRPGRLPAAPDSAFGTLYGAARLRWGGGPAGVGHDPRFEAGAGVLPAGSVGH